MIQVLQYVDISCNGATMYLVILVFLICVTDSIKGFSRCRILEYVVVYLLCVYIFGWLCRATYCSVVSILMLGVSHLIQNKEKLYKFTQSDSVYLLYLL